MKFREIIKGKKLVVTLLLTFCFGALAQFGADRVINWAVSILKQVASTPSNPDAGYLKIYSKSSDGKMYKLDSSGVESEIGSGGGGKNFFTRSGTTSDYSATGNNATFDGGGTIDGAFSISTTAADLIDDENQINVYKYVASSASQNDYVASAAIDIPQGFTGRVVGFEFYYKTSGFSDDEIEFGIKDTTNGTILSDQLDTTLDACAPSDNSSCRAVMWAYVPTDCAQVEVGFHFTGSISTSDTLLWDELKIADDLHTTNKLVEMTSWETYTPVTQGVGTPTFSTALWRRVGDSVHLLIRMTLGTTTASEFQIGLPSGATVKSGLSNHNVGAMLRRDDNWNNTTDTQVYALATGGDSYINYGYINNTTIAMTPQNNAQMGTGQQVDIVAVVPIEGWSATGDHVVSATDNVQPSRVELLDTGATVATGTKTYLGFRTLDKDLDGNIYNLDAAPSTTYTSTTYWLCPATGYYQVQAQWMTADPVLDVDENISTHIDIDGTMKVERVMKAQYSAASPRFSTNIGSVLYVEKGEKVSIAITQDSGSNMILSSSTGDSFFSVHRIDKSPITVVPPLNSVSPSLANSAATTALADATSTYLGFLTTDSDIEGNFTNVGSASSTTQTSTTYWTCPKSGFYTVNVGVNFDDADLDANEAIYLSIRGDSGANLAQFLSRTGDTATSPRRPLAITKTLYITKGSIISVQVYNGVGASLTPKSGDGYAWFEVVKVY